MTVAVEHSACSLGSDVRSDATAAAAVAVARETEAAAVSNACAEEDIRRQCFDVDPTVIDAIHLDVANVDSVDATSAVLFLYEEERTTAAAAAILFVFGDVDFLDNVCVDGDDASLSSKDSCLTPFARRAAFSVGNAFRPAVTGAM